MSLREVRWIDLPHVSDERGVLTSIESGLDIPFDIRRVFFMYAVRADRGGHAHRSTRQLLLSPAGEFSVDLFDGHEAATYRLSDRNRGLYLPPLTWVRLYDFAPAAVCLAFADTHYDGSAYIRHWEEFVAAVRAGARPA